MTIQTMTASTTIADALIFVHGEMALQEARRHLALNRKSGVQRHVKLWQDVFDAVKTDAKLRTE